MTPHRTHSPGPGAGPGGLPANHRRGTRRRPAAIVVALLTAVAAVGCSDADQEAGTPDPAAETSAAGDDTVSDPPATVSPPTSEAAPSTAAATTAPDTTAAPTTAAPTTAAPTTAAPTTAVPTTAAPTTTAPAVVETREIGASVQGRPITAVRRGTPGGRVVLVIGVIHGNEDDGVAVIDLLEQYDVPAGVDLWLVESINPDGQVAQDRHNANDVDLNRNFPADWGPIGEPGDGQYAGPSVASEPETQAIMAFVDEIRPDLVLWYHQDLFRISPGRGRDGAIRARYAELTGLPVLSITGGIYTGVAATWVRRTIDPGVSFIVELGPTLTPEEADVHARAVLTIASEPN